MGKLPYIRDKKMYAAVMGACSYVRDTGYFNKATDYYADKYGVDVDEVRKYVRIAQGNGQKTANSGESKKYFWFAVEYSIGGERHGADYFVKEWAQYQVVKGLSAKTVTSRISEPDYSSRNFTEYGRYYYFGRVKGFATKADAEAAVKRWKEE